MSVPDYKINYKSDFVLTINGDAGWAVPFCIKFWTGMPSQAYFVGFDGVKYVNCRVGDTPTQLMVMFDDHHLPIGPLKMQIAYHTTIEEFPGSVFDEVTNARDVIVTIDGTDYQVLLDFTGEDAPELEFDLPAYANEAERIQNELQRQQNEADRIAAELQREQATAAAVQGAENVNAQLNGTTLTVTNRQGVSTSVNTKGEQGEQGPVGPEGPQGQKGVSIVSFLPKSETSTILIYTITYSNGYTQDVAIPKGPKGDTGATGPTGPQGPQGVSVIGFTQTGETATNTMYNLVFSDGRTQSVAIPKGVKGDKGDTGNPGPQGAQGPKGDTVTATDYTLYNVQGSDSQGAMSQDATTKAISAQTGYYTCGTAAATAAKVATMENGNLYKRTLGGHFKVKMTNVNTASGVTLQIGSETAATLWYNGAAVSASNTWDAGEVISVYYDGTYYQASNAQGGSNKKINAYLYGDLRTLAVGQNYEIDESVKTTDKQLRRLIKDITPLSLSETLASGALKVSGNATYRAASPISTYNPNPSTPYTAGAYALGSMTVYTLTVTAETVTAGNITVNGTEVAVEETDTADAIATKIAAALNIEGWTDSADGNVITVRCNTIGNNTTAITIGVGDTGVVVDGTSTPTITGTNVIMKYNGESWAIVSDVPTMEADGKLVSVDEAWLITNATQQNSVTQDIKKDLTIVVSDTLVEQYKDRINYATGERSQLNLVWGNRHNVANIINGIYWRCHGSATTLSVYKIKSGSSILLKQFRKDNTWVAGQWVKLYFDNPVDLSGGYFIGVYGYVYYGTISGVGLQFNCNTSGGIWRVDNNIAIGFYTFYEKNRLDDIEENIEEIEDELHGNIKTSFIVDRDGNKLILPLDRIITNPTGQQITLSENRFTQVGATTGGYLTAAKSGDVWTTIWYGSTIHRCSNYIDIHDATKLTVGCDVTANLVYFDENKICCGNFVGNGSFTAKTTTPPAGAYYVRMNYDTRHIASSSLIVYFNVNTYNLNPIVAIPSDNIPNFKPLSGLKVAWYGTSIPHGYPYQNSDQATYSYANRAVTELGGIIQNRCVSGGFIISATNTADTHNQTSRFTDIDPEGTYYSAVNYKTRIVDLIGTADEPDIFVFDWGANDGQFYQSYFNGINLDTVDITTEDIKTFIGAYNTIIKALLTAKPKARIFLVTHYSDDGQSNEMTRKDGYRTMNRLIEKIADYWHIPCNSVYKKTGWIYNRNGISNIRSQWCKDGIHPANSANVESIKFLTKIHKQFLMENYCY